MLIATSSGKASIFILFGSHSTKEVYFDELQNFYNICTPFVMPFLHTKNIVKVGFVKFQQDDSQGNSVLAYLQRHGTPIGLTTPLTNEGYTLTNHDISTAFNVPLTIEPYSKISREINPIHINPYFSDFPSLSATITHNLWLSAATCRFVETVAAASLHLFFSGCVRAAALRGVVDSIATISGSLLKIVNYKVEVSF